MKRQRGYTVIVYALIALAVLGAIAGIIAWADSNIETTAGLRAGRAEVTAAWAAANEQARKAEREKSDVAAKGLQADRVKTKTIIKKVTSYVDRIIDRPVYRNVCLDPDGVRCANAAILGQVSTGCGADDAVPAPDHAR